MAFLITITNLKEKLLKSHSVTGKQEGFESAQQMI